MSVNQRAVIARKIRSGEYPRYMQMEVDTLGLSKKALKKVHKGYIFYGAIYDRGKCIRRPLVKKIISTRWALENG